MIPRAAAAAALGLALAGLTGAAAALPSEPVVAPGHAVPVAVGGFRADVPVTIQLVGSASGHRVVRADAHGRVRTGYAAPQVTGEYRLLLSGLGATRPGHRVSSNPDGPGDHQAITVTVPLVVGLPFHVGGSGVDSGNLGPGPSGNKPSGSGGGGLATTGSDLRAPVLLAAVLLVLGAGVAAAGRRRRAS